MVHLHDALALSISYGGEENKPFHYYTLEGPLAEGVGVCGGIARGPKNPMKLAGGGGRGGPGTGTTPPPSPEPHTGNM